MIMYKNNIANCRLKTANWFSLLLTAYCVLAFTTIHPEIRYVSHTGTSTPPYTTWETAADSIQKAINICVDGDTVIVANGVYYETIIVDKEIWLIGSSMDSTVIDATGLLPTFGAIYFFENDSHIENFNIIGPGESSFRSGISTRRSNVVGENCRISNSYEGLSVNFSSANFSNFIIENVSRALTFDDPADTSHPSFKNSLIIYTGDFFNPVVYLSFGGNPIIENNIIMQLSNSNSYGIYSEYNKGMKVESNYVAGFGNANIKVGQIGEDTAYVINNVSLYAKPLTGSQKGSIVINSGEKTVLKNNIIGNGYRGIYCYGLTVNPEYNLFWNIEELAGGNVNMGVGNITADPMFIKDTLPNESLDFDYHLQKYSPAIDAGDPDILDIDSTRSDIGMFGGLLGEKYSYKDLAPKSPRNLSAVVDTNEIFLKWNKNTEADTSHYNIYRDTVINFIIDSTKLVSSQADTSYIQTIPPGFKRLVYKITAVDNQGNESLPSEEVVVNITSIVDYPFIVNDYYLYQNYPNPFNPSTNIGYKLKERGYVKLMVYDIKGELVSVLVNQEQEAGYYEVEFNAEVDSRQLAVGNQLASGIYLYRIEVIGEGNIPVYSDMKKMVFIK